MTKVGFSLQSEHKFYINTVPGVTAPETNFARVAGGISSFEPEWNEEIDQTNYLDGDGYSSSDVTGAQLVLTFEGHRKYGDAAQDFIASLQPLLGEERKTEFRWIDANGDTFEGNVTVANIVGASGDANEKSGFSFEIHFNGKPQYTPSSNDTTKPTVTVSPTDGATTVAVGSNIVWTFSEAIRDSSLSLSNFIVTKATDGTEVEGSLSINVAKTVVTFDPTVNLSAATEYIAIATSNIQDTAGNYMATSSITNFRTA
ncbi:MAG TPA: Ig-like domain-containing protein [Rummeliibacillus sp.]|nr:Ig-like domain-containing protein [Rummeliibacillus sp.]